MRVLLLNILFVLIGTGTFAQMSKDEKLARYYMGKGEYEKAVDYTKKLNRKYNSVQYYEMHLTCLFKLEDWNKAEKTIEKKIKEYPYESRFKLDLAEYYELTDQGSKSDDIYRDLIKQSANSTNRILSLARSLKDEGKYDLALEALLAGKKNNNGYPFHFQIAEVYSIKGQTQKMIDELLEVLQINRSYKNSTKILLTRYLELDGDEEEDSSIKKNRDLLKKSLLLRIQKDANNTLYPEMLIWLYTLEENFEGALIQAKALDRREKGDGRRIIQLAREAVQAQAFDVAEEAYQSVIDKGEKTVYYRTAKIEKIHAGYQKLQIQKSSKEDIKQLVREYRTALNELGENPGTISLIMELAEIEAFYNQSPEKAIALLKEALQIPRLETEETGRLKLQLADVYLIKNEIWESSLLYSQVEKAFKHDPLGAEAKFKNAKISYYAGDFSWAQAQLKVLKASTSKLIANNALQLSLLITDNMGMDTTSRPMLLFAEADLLITQRKFEEAFQKLDTLEKEFPFHKLKDDILLKKAKALIEMYDYDAAIKKLLEINTAHKNDLLADDALFLLGEIHENKLHLPEKAAEYYKKILFEHKASLLVDEARKRFRKLRGDDEKQPDKAPKIDLNP